MPEKCNGKRMLKKADKQSTKGLHRQKTSWKFWVLIPNLL